ncbi:MAG: ApaG domain [Alphaproteobacteria bacterium]|nr:ApaG domain [Alphaproteobacteria bacterium]
MFEQEELFLSQEGIDISAYPVLIEEENMCGYYFCIENNSDQKIQLLGKNWNVTDALGNIFTDSSEGFKGELPELEPGECFEYTDTMPLCSSQMVFYGSCSVLRESSVQEVKLPTMTWASREVENRVLN